MRNCGSWRYSLDPTTEVLCLTWRLPSWAEGRTALWHPAFPHLGIEERFDWRDIEELVNWIEAGGLVEAHNAWFERGIWQNILVPQYGFPPITSSQWRCSAAKAAAHALPRALEDAAMALELNAQKDTEGEKVMKKLAKPRKARKAERELAEEEEREIGLLWFESKEMFDRLCEYCRTDVVTETELSDSLDDLNDLETAVFLMDQQINERGFQLDTEAIATALALIETEVARLNAELAIVTNGYVSKATQRAMMLAWLQYSEDVYLPDTTKDTIDNILSSGRTLPPNARRALEIMRTIGRSSTAKFMAMKNWVCPDARVHGGVLYHGASTGRWSGKGVQPHNFPKGKIKDQETLWTLLKTRNVDRIVTDALQDKGKPLYTTVMEALSHGLRGVIVPSPGRQLYVADYAAIEARVLLWLAGEEDALDIFRRGEDIYCDMASSIYGYPTHKDTHPTERALGKVAVLGLGYQMGAPKFQDTCLVMAKIEIDEDLAQQTVDAYRAKYWRVKAMWTETERAAIEAVRHPGRRVACGYVTWVVEGYFLFCELPSGRRLAYPNPEVRSQITPWGEERPQLTFKGVNPMIRKWVRQHTYGGMLVENITQAVARDLMAEAMLRCEATGIYDVILTVHDEIVAEADLGKGSVKEFERLVATCPDWAEGCPVEAEGWAGVRYRK